ncbi:MAG: D-alanine--D-alanine ligase, partial [Bacteroidota bacterium]
DPNTTAGMNPSSYLFHQAAEIGLNPTQLLTLLIRTSLAVRIKEGKVAQRAHDWLAQLDHNKVAQTQNTHTKIRVGVVMGGFSAERHVSLEGGRNIYEKLASSAQYEPIPLFLTDVPQQPSIYTLPINLLLKENVDDIRARLVEASAKTPQTTLAAIRQEAADITQQYGSAGALQVPRIVSYEALAHMVDFVFLALHGRPGEDGTLQATLAQHHIPHNGSGIRCMERTMDKFQTNQFLRIQGMHVADQVLVKRADWIKDPEGVTQSLATQLGYPMIVKPVDEGCSAAVIKIRDAAMLVAYAEATFRKDPYLSPAQRSVLGIQSLAAFPQKDVFLAEALITQGDAAHFLEITGGLLTHYDEQGNRRYEMFMPSETVATGEVLSLEEKFLAGEGQNITPARFHPDQAINQQIAEQVQQDL